jgi:hypothetical protein
LQERVERSAFGRALISAFLLVTLISIVIANFPRSTLRRDVLRVSAPYLNATGLDQGWSLFAPNPRRQSIALYARVQFANGAAQTWGVPHGDPLTGNYWDSHWQKWVVFVVNGRHRDLWKPAAEFIARDLARPGRRPVRVTLIRQTSLNYPPGHHPDGGPNVATAYYSLAITPAMLASR